MKKINVMKQVLFNYENDQPILFDDAKEELTDFVVRKEKPRKIAENQEKKSNANLVSVAPAALAKNVSLFEVVEEEVDTRMMKHLNTKEAEIFEEKNIFEEPKKPDIKIDSYLPVIKVIGIGGAGNNIVEYISNPDNNIAIHPNVIFYQLNTDAQHLNYLSRNKNKILIKSSVTNGRGTGGNPECGKRAAEDFEGEIKKIVSGADICIIIAGLGKGTGTGGAPVVARIAKEMGILTLSINTTPSRSEGNKAWDNALYGLRELKEVADSITTICNENALFSNHDDNTKRSLPDMYAVPNALIGQTIKSITDIVLLPGYLNIDLADLNNFFSREEFIKAFSSISARFRVEDIKCVTDILDDKVKHSLFDQKLKDASSAIVMFYSNDATPSNLISDTLNHIKELVNNPNLNIVYGIIKHQSELVGFDIIALREGTTTVGCTISNNYAPDRNDALPNSKITITDTPLKSIYRGKRSAYLQSQKQIKVNDESAQKYEMMQNELNNLIHTKKLDTDGVYETVEHAVRTFYSRTKTHENSSEISDFDESNLFKS